MFFGLQVDRGNLVQAVSDNMLDDLDLSTNGIHSATACGSHEWKLIICRVQHGKYYLLHILSSCRAAIAAGLEANWP